MAGSGCLIESPTITFFLDALNGRKNVEGIVRDTESYLDWRDKLGCWAPEDHTVEGFGRFSRLYLALTGMIESGRERKYTDYREEEILAIPWMEADLCAARIAAQDVEFNAKVLSPDQRLRILSSANQQTKGKLAPSVAQVSTSIAFYGEESSTQKRAELLPLTLTLFRDPESVGDLALSLYPSLQTSFDFFSNKLGSSSKGGWWTSLDRACEAAVQLYLTHAANAEHTLSGQYVARWHLENSLLTRAHDADKNFLVFFEGNSHGAAFAVALAKALAIAHQNLK